MTNKAKVLTESYVGDFIVTIRDQKVILDHDLARLYSVETKILNKAIGRNAARFPADFMFKLTQDESDNLRFHFGTSSLHGGRRYLPYAFTEHGAIMAAMILNSPQAVRMSVFVVRAFTKMRQKLVARTEMENRLLQIETILLAHDDKLRALYEKIRPLLLPPPEPPHKQIGFHVKESCATYSTKRGGK